MTIWAIDEEREVRRIERRDRVRPVRMQRRQRDGEPLAWMVITVCVAVALLAVSLGVVGHCN